MKIEKLENIQNERLSYQKDKCSHILRGFDNINQLSIALQKLLPTED